MQFLQGYKTYIVGIAALIYAGVAVYFGFMTPMDAGPIVLGALGIMGLRGGVNTALAIVLQALGVQLPPAPSLKTMKSVVAKAGPVIRRSAPMLFACVLVGMSLTACATDFSNPQQDIAYAQDTFYAAQTLYNTICATNSDASFCTPDKVAAANDAAALVQSALNTADLVLANSGSTQAQITAAIQGLQDAVKKFSAVISDLQTAKQKAMATRYGVRVSSVEGIENLYVMASRFDAASARVMADLKAQQSFRFFLMGWAGHLASRG